MRITQEMAMQVVGRSYPQRIAQPSNTSAVSNVEDWIKREVGSGLFLILTERLPYAPKMEEYRTLIPPWSYVFKRRLGLAVEEVDAPRMREAFCQALELDKWPAASQVADLMPRRPARPTIPHLPQRTPYGFEQLKKIQQMQHKNEQLLNWLEQADRGGLSLTLQQLNTLLSTAPPGAQNTPEFAYLEGFRDHKFLTEQIGGQKNADNKKLLQN